MKVSMGQPNDLLLDDLELLLREIDEFNLAISNNKPLDIPQSLENYLQFVAKSGNTVFPWPHVRNLIRTKMVNAIQQFQEPTCPNETFVLERFDLFRLAAPFTVQRLTELILQPTRHYRKKEKFLRGLEKTVLVVSTIEPHSLTNDEEKNGNDLNNTSGSSCEAETETVTFNRTITLDPQDILTTSIRTSAIDVLNVGSASDNLVLDAVTTSAVGSAVTVIDQNISVTTAGLLAETISSSDVSSIDVITTDKPISVTSEGIILESVSNVSATVVASMESEEAQDALSSSIDVINQTSSESMIIDPVAATVAVDVINSNICVSSGSVGTASFATSAVSSVDIASDKTIAIAPECAIPVYESAAAGVTCVESEEGQDILISSDCSDSVNQTASESIILDPVTTSAVGAVDVVDPNANVAPVDVESISSSAVASIDAITTDKPVLVDSDSIPPETVSDSSSTDMGSSMESDEAPQGILSSSEQTSATNESDSMDQSTSESMIIDPVAPTDTAIVEAVNPSTICVATEGVVSSNETTSSAMAVDISGKEMPESSEGTSTTDTSSETVPTDISSIKTVVEDTSSSDSGSL